jgi:hypothetical protein
MEGRGFADEFRKLMKIPHYTGDGPNPNDEQTTADIETDQVADSVDAINPIDKSITLHKITMDEELLFKFSTMYLFNGITPDSKSTRHLNYLTSWIIEADKLFVVDLDAIPGRLKRLQHVQVVVFINNETLNFQIFIENNNRTTEVRNIFREVYNKVNISRDKDPEALWKYINSNYREELKVYLEKQLFTQNVNDWLIREDCIKMGFQTRKFEVKISDNVAIGEHTKGTLAQDTIQQKTINTFYADDYLTVNDYDYARKLSTLEGYNYHDKNGETTFVKHGKKYHLDVNWMAENSFYEKFWDDKSNRKNLVAFIEKGKIELTDSFKDAVQKQIENNINAVAQCMYYVGNSDTKVFPTISHFKMFVPKLPMDNDFIVQINTWKKEYFEKLKLTSNKEDSKEDLKEDSKEDLKEDSKEDLKEDSKEDLKEDSKEDLKKSFEDLSSKFLQQLRHILNVSFPVDNMTTNARTMTVYQKTLMHYVRSLWLLDNTTIYQRKILNEVREDKEPKNSEKKEWYQNTDKEGMIDKLFSSYHIISLFDSKYYKEFKEVLDSWNKSSTNHFANGSGNTYEDVSERTKNSFEIFPISNKKSGEAEENVLPDNMKEKLRDNFGEMPFSGILHFLLQYHFEMLTFPEMLHFVLLSFGNENTTSQVQNRTAWKKKEDIDRSFLIEWSSSQISRYVKYLSLFTKNQTYSKDFQSIMDRIGHIPQIDELQEFRGILEDSSKHLRQLFVKDKNTADELSKIWDISYHYFENGESSAPEYGIGSIQSLRNSSINHDDVRHSRLNKDKVLRDIIVSRLSNSKNYMYGSDYVNTKRILNHYQYLGGNMQLIILELISFKMKCLSSQINYNFENFITNLTDIRNKYQSIATRFPGLALTALPHLPISDNLPSRSVHTKNVRVQNNSSWRNVDKHDYNILYRLRKEEKSFFGAVPCTACPNTLQPNNGNLEIFFSYAFHVITCISRFVHTFTEEKDEPTERKWNITNLFVENYGHICSRIKTNKESESFNNDRANRLLENSRHIISSDFECFELALKDLYKHPKLLNLLYLIKGGDEVIIQNAAKFVYGEEIDNDEYRKFHIYVQDQWRKGIFDLKQNNTFAKISLKNDESDPNNPLKNAITLYQKIANIFYEYVNDESFLSEKSGQSDLMARVRNEKVLAIQKFCNLYFNPDIVERFTKNVTAYVNTHIANKEEELQKKFTNSMENKGKSDKFSTLLHLGTEFYNKLQGQTFDDANIESYTYRKSLILYCQYLQQLLESTRPQDYETLFNQTKTLQTNAIRLLPP